MHWNVNVSHLCNNIANRSLWMGNLINVFYDIRYYDNGKTNLNHHLSLMCFVTWPLFYIFSMKHDVYIHRMTLIDDISWRKCHLWVPTIRISNRLYLWMVLKTWTPFFMQNMALWNWLHSYETKKRMKNILSDSNKLFLWI